MAVPTPARVENTPVIPNDVIVANVLPAATAPIELWVAAATLPAMTPAVPNPMAIGMNPAAAIAPPPIIASVPKPKGIFLFEIKKLNLENEELKINFVQVSELREKETQNYKYNLNVLRSNLEILEQDKQRHINQNIIEKENLENQVQILMKENNILNQRIKQIIEQNEILNKQIFELNILNFGKNKKMKNSKENKNKINKNKIINTDIKNNNSKFKKDKIVNLSNNNNNNNLKQKNAFSINIKTENKNKNNFPMKISKTSKFSESNNMINFDKNFSIEINKLDNNVINSKSNLNSNLLSKDSTKFNIIENDDIENKDSNKNETVKYIPQKFNKYQSNNESSQIEKKELNNRDKVKDEISYFANKYLNNQNNDNINFKNDLLLKNASIEIKNKDFEKENILNIDKSKNINET